MSGARLTAVAARAGLSADELLALLRDDTAHTGKIRQGTPSGDGAGELVSFRGATATATRPAPAKTSALASFRNDAAGMQDRCESIPAPFTSTFGNSGR